MNVFSDDDLKRLKNELTSTERIGIEYLASEKIIKPLLARLEAAERVIADGACCIDECPRADEARDAWRKAAGK